MLHIVGNGPSRKQYDLNSFEEWWGCNGVYRDHTPDILFVHDIPVQHQAVVDGCLGGGRVAGGAGNHREVDWWDGLKRGCPKAIQKRTEEESNLVDRGGGDEGR